MINRSSPLSPDELDRVGYVQHCLSQILQEAVRSRGDLDQTWSEAAERLRATVFDREFGSRDPLQDLLHREAALAVFHAAVGTDSLEHRKAWRAAAVAHLQQSRDAAEKRWIAEQWASHFKALGI